MKSKSPFLSKSPLKSQFPGDLGSQYLSGELQPPPFISSLPGRDGALGGPPPDLNNIGTIPFSPTYDSSGNDLRKGGPIINTPRPDTGTNAFQGETLSQQRTSEQMRASNEARLAAGGTRGRPGDAGYASQVNAVTGLTPDAFAGDEILPASEGMGAVIASGDGPANNALIESGEAMGPITTTTAGERVGAVGAQSGLTGFLDEGGNAIQTSELADDMQDDSWINDTGAVTMPGETPTPVGTQTTQVQSGGAPSPAVDNANIPESMGGTDLNAGSNSQPGCNNNYVGDGDLYDNMR
jgi:hypothetical protein